MGGNPEEGGLQTFQLELFQVGTGHALLFFFPVSGIASHSYLLFSSKVLLLIFTCSEIIT
jgi:hypothetical protein